MSTTGADAASAHVDTPDDDDIERLLRQSLRPRGTPDTVDSALRAYFEPQRGVAPWGERAISNPTAGAWAAVVASHLAEVGMPAGGIFSGKSGWDALSAVADGLLRESDAVAGRRARAVWLALVRRLDVDILSVYSKGTRCELRELLYEMGNRSTRPVREQAFQQMLTKPSQPLLDDLGDLVSLAAVRKTLNAALRRVGKDQPVRLAVENGVVRAEWDSTSEVESAIALLDSRIEAGGGSPDHLGAYGTLVGAEWTDQSTIVWTNLLDQDLVPPELRTELLSTADPYFPVLAQLDKYLPALRFLKNVDLTWSLAGAALLEVAWRYLQSIGAQGKRSRGDWSRAGYILLPRTKLARLWRQVLDSDPRYTPIDDWPLERVVDDSVGRALLPVGHKMILDLMRAGAMFLDSVNRAKEGTEANAWGATFQTSVQDIIDASSWRPLSRLRELIGRTVKHQGQTVTDIDCVADVGGTVVLIDAKAHAASDAYRKGEWSAVRGLRRTIEAESATWTEKVKRLSRDRADFGLSQLGLGPVISLVVVPFVPYLSIGPATREVIVGLRAVSSADELLQAAHANELRRETERQGHAQQQRTASAERHEDDCGDQRGEAISEDSERGPAAARQTRLGET